MHMHADMNSTDMYPRLFKLQTLLLLASLKGNTEFFAIPRAGHRETRDHLGKRFTVPLNY